MKAAFESSNAVLNKLPTFFMLVTLLGGFILSLLAMYSYNIPEKTTVRSILKGELAGDFEVKLDEDIAFRQFAISAWGIIEYLLFKEGRKGVLVGAEDWLFTDEEFTFYPEESSEVSSKLELIQKVKKQLDEQEILLVVALLPAKTQIYKEKLGKHNFPSYTQERYTNFRQELLNIGVSTTDLVQPLLLAKATKDTFLKTDTHWTPFGAKMVANVIASEAKSLGFASRNTGDFITEQQGMVDHEGDLLNFIPLGKLQYLGPKPDKLSISYTFQKSKSTSGLELFGNNVIPVALVGTSYSANPLWNFEGALKNSLGVDVLNVADEGQGPIIPMINYLKSKSFLESPPELIIWEIPERFLPIHYDY